MGKAVTIKKIPPIIQEKLATIIMVRTVFTITIITIKVK